MLKVFSRSTVFYLIAVLVTSVVFLPLSSVDAATLTTGMNASYVIGQPNFTTDTPGTTQEVVKTPADIVYDGSQYLYVSELYNHRVLVFDISGGITNGMAASYVLGQEDFVSTATTTPGGEISSSTMHGPIGLNLDNSNGLLFVSDSQNNRVLVFDISGGITNGMAASYVLGQQDFTSADITDAEGSRSEETMYSPSGVFYRASDQYLFVTDLDNNRVLVFDLSGGVTTGMGASYVIGQDNFTAGASSTDQSGLSSPGAVHGDDENIFVTDYVNNRMLVFDVATGISNGMAASYVIGQTDFVSSASGASPTRFNGPAGVYYDSDNSRLFVADQGNNRTLVYDTSGGITSTMAASYVLGQQDLVSNVGSTTQSGSQKANAVRYDNNSGYLFVGDIIGHRIMVFDLSPTGDSSQQSSSSFSYIHPPLCSAQFTPSTITKGESTTYSWNTTWPTDKQNTYYTKVPGKDGGLFSHNVHSIQMTPEHTQTITTYVFNLWGATPCTTTITVLDQEGNEVLPTNKNNLTISAGASNHPFIRPFVLIFAKLFVR